MLGSAVTGDVRRPRVIAGAVLAAAIAVSLALAGCSGSTTSTPTKTATPVKTTAASTPTPTPTPTPTFARHKYNCESLLPPATLSVFKARESAGFTLQSDYLERMQNIGSNLLAFNQYGGILCQWAYADSSSSVDYAYSKISDSETATQEAALTSNGYVGASADHGTLYKNTDTADYPDEYLFIHGYWFQASSDNLMQLIVDNVFVSST